MSLAPSQENKTEKYSAWACVFSRQIPRYFADTICLSWGFLKWLFLKTRRARISLMRFTFLDNASRLPLSLPNSILYQVHPENFRCVPPKRSFPILQLSTEWYSLDLNFVLHNLGRFFFFFFRAATAPWVPSSRPRAEVALTISLSTQATIAMNASVSRHVTTTHGMMSIITRRYFSSCSQ